MIEEIREVTEEAAEKKEVRVRKAESTKGNDWWDQECGEAKKEALSALRRWKAKEVGKEEYIKKKKKFREKCRVKKEMKREEEIERMKRIKSEKEVWEYINRERKIKVGVDESIEIEQWEKYFQGLLGSSSKEGGDERVTTKRGEINREGEVESITLEEVKEQIQKLKRRKTPGGDGIQNEAWIFGNDELAEKLTEIINKVWKGGGFPEAWREGLIYPIHKKGEKERMENYRGITVLNTGYKIYAAILRERLVRELEEKKILADSQAGFREGRGTMDNIYILDHMVKRELRKKGGKLYVLFIDFKAAFDTVDREKMLEHMEKVGISEQLIRKVEEIYSETRSKVKIGKRESRWFKSDRGVRQGCPLSPTLFTLYISEMEEVLRKKQAGGVVIGREKVWCLAFADDIAVCAKNKREMEEAIRTVRKYVEKKKLEVNVKKTKVMVFNKGGRRGGDEGWRWGDEELERVTAFKYLGYTFNERGTARAHIKEIVNKANRAMGAVWGIGERKFGNSYERKMRIFDSLIGSILLYGAEIWGWKEWDEVEKVQEKYVRWVLGLSKETPGYIVREEGKRAKMRVKAGMRAMKFEDRMMERAECKLVSECWREKMRKKEDEERENYHRRNGYASSEVERRRREGIWAYRELAERDRDIDKQERRERIRESRYNPKYDRLITEERPSYLDLVSSKERKKVARFRCGNEERDNRYWEKEENRLCRICYAEKETVEHLLASCEGMKEREGASREEILNERGKGREWMREVYESRRRRGEKYV